MKRIITLIAAGFLSALMSVNVQAADVYKLDAVHSSIGFTVKHMMVAKVNGGFNEYEADVKFDAKDLADSRFDFVIKAASIDTRNEARDNHLRNGDFFDTEKYPLIMFKTKKVEKSGDNVYAVTGDLTMKAITKEIVIPVTVDGPVFHPMAKTEAIGVEAVFKLDRQDYGVNWNKTLDNGGLVVANEVNVIVNLEAHKAGN